MARYFPTFSTRPHELLAYEKLSGRTKDAVTPIVTLTRHNRATSFGPAMAALLEAAAGRPVIVDFDPEPKPETSEQEATVRRKRAAERKRRSGEETREPTERQLQHWAELRKETADFNAHVDQLVASTTGASKWLTLAFKFPELIPIIQLSSRESIRRQIAIANEVDRPVAFKISAGEIVELQFVIEAVSSLANPSGSFLILHGNHIRGQTTATVQRLNAALLHLEERLGRSLDALECVAVTGSFPSGSLRELPRSLAIEELEIFDALSQDWDLQYGDYASIQQRAPRAGGAGWFPHVDLALDTEWKIDLTETNSDSGGYVKSARRIKNSAEWRARADCWGTRMIAEAAEGRLHQRDVTLTIPGPWIGVRANQHITQQSAKL